MTLVALGLFLAGQQPARAVEMSATLGGKPYGRVVYVRQSLPGRGLERTLTLEVQEDAGSYRIEEKRTYALDGTPLTTVRTYTEGERTVVMKVVYDGLKASLSCTEGTETESDDVPLTAEGATTRDASQFWFQGTVPAAKAESKFWEYSLDEDAWVERKVKYEGIASLKIGEKTVQAHRLSLSGDVNWYVDENGMPYKSVQKTAAGDLVLVRTAPEAQP